MSPKLGQKIAENPKSTTVRARMDKETIEKLDYIAESQGLDRSKVIRKGIEIQYEELKK